MMLGGIGAWIYGHPFEGLPVGHFTSLYADYLQKIYCAAIPIISRSASNDVGRVRGTITIAHIMYQCKFDKHKQYCNYKT